MTNRQELALEYFWNGTTYWPEIMFFIDGCITFCQDEDTRSDLRLLWDIALYRKLNG